MKKKKMHFSWHLTPSQFNEGVEVDFIVEAKLGKKWRKIGGPFPDRSSANEFAEKYSRDNPGIEIQVVVFQ